MKYKPLFFVTASFMFLLGAMDALRGVFAPLFTSYYGISSDQLGMIISASYLGCLLFMPVGGFMIDRCGIRKTMVTMTLLLSASAFILLFSTGFASLTAGFLFSIGFSTLLNASANMYAGRFSEKNPMMWINIIYMMMCLGLTTSQFFVSKYAESVSAWHISILFFALVFIPIAIFFMKAKGLETVKTDEKASDEKDRSDTDWLSIVAVTLALTCYLIAEHGTFNYFMMFGMEGIHLTPSAAGRFLSMYTLGMMVGRLVFSPIVETIGSGRMIMLSLLFSFLFSVPIYIWGHPGFTFVMGLGSAIVYPTCVALTRRFVPQRIAGRMTTAVISIASAADIIFNGVFGKLSEIHGWGTVMPILTAFFLLGTVLSVPLMRKKALEA